MIVWDVIKEFEGADVDLEDMLTEIVLNPVLIKDLVPFMLAQLPLEVKIRYFPNFLLPLKICTIVFVKCEAAFLLQSRIF